MIGLRAGDASSAALSASCAATCSGPKTKGVPLHVRDVRGCARRAKFLMKMWTTPMVPKKACTSEMSAHGPQLATLSTFVGSGMRPSGVQTCPTTVISWVHRSDFFPENVPPQYFIRCTMRLTFWKCSQTKRRILLFSGMVSKTPSLFWYVVAGPQTGTSSIYGMVNCGTSGCRMRCGILGQRWSNPSEAS